MLINWICHTKSVYQKSLNQKFQMIFLYKIIFWICASVLRIHKSYFGLYHSAQWKKFRKNLRIGNGYNVCIVTRKKLGLAISIKIVILDDFINIVWKMIRQLWNYILIVQCVSRICIKWHCDWPICIKWHRNWRDNMNRMSIKWRGQTISTRSVCFVV